MTTGEALKKLKGATAANVAMDVEMVFGYGVDDAVEMCNTATACNWVGPHFVVTCPAFVFCAEFVDGIIILVSGPSPRR
jgi:hypothetical protein